MRITSFLFLFFIAFISYAQQIPKNPNTTLANGKKHGLWTVLVDKDWNEVPTKEQASYYRLIEYAEGKPKGTVRDYFLDGRLQWQGQLITENPDVNEGFCTWYDEKGNKTQELNFKNGLKEGKGTYYSAGKKYSEGTYTNDRSNNDWIYYGGDYNSYYQTAGQSAKLGEFKKAEENFLKANELAIKSFGDFSIQHLNAQWNLTFVYQSWGKWQEMIRAWRETMRISQQVQQIDALLMAQFTEGLAVSLDQSGLKAEALELYKFAVRKREPKNLNEEYKLYWDWKYILDKSYSLGRVDSLHYYFAKTAGAVPVTDNGNAGTLRDWAGYAVAKKSYDQFDNIEKRCEQYLRAKEQAGQKDGAYAEVWIALGKLMLARGQYERALQSFAQARVVYKKDEKTLAGYVRALSHSVETYNASKTFDAEAKQLIAELVEANERSDKTNWEAYVQNMEVAGTAYLNMSDYEHAEVLVEKMLKILEEKVGKTDEQYLTLTMVMRGIVSKTGHTEKLEGFEGYSKKDEKKIINNMGLADGMEQVEQLGKYLGAQDYVNAVKVFERHATMIGNFYKQQNQYSSYVLMTLGIAYSYRQTGNLTKSYQLLTEAYALSKEKLPKSDDSYIIALMSMGEFHQITGSLEEAEKNYAEALRTLNETRTEKNKKDNDEMYYNIAARLASVLGSQGYYEDAEKWFLDILDYKQRVYGKNDPLYAVQKRALADLYHQMHLFALAESYYLEIEPVVKKAGGGVLIDWMNSLAVNYQVRGNYKEAEPLYLKLKDHFARTVGTKSNDYERIVSNLALMYYHDGLMDKANVSYDEANQLLITRIDNFFSMLSEQEKADFYATVQKQFNSYNSFTVKYAATNKRELGDMYTHQLLTKGLLFRSTNQVRETILASKDDSLKTQYQRWLTRKDYLAKVYQMSAEEKKAAGIDEKKVEESVNALERDITRKSQRFANLIAARPDWKQVQSKLKPGEAAVEIVRIFDAMPAHVFSYIGKGIAYDSLGEGGYARVVEIHSQRTPAFKAGLQESDVILEINGQSTKGKTQKQIGDLMAVNPVSMKLKKKAGTTYQVKLAADSVFERTFNRKVVYAALILTPQTVDQPDLVVLNNGDQLEGRSLRYYRNAIHAKFEDVMSYDQYWKPIRDKIGNAKKVYFSPDGSYNMININTLLNTETGKYVLDETEVELVSNTSDLLKASTASDSKQAILIGFPDYNKVGSGNQNASAAQLDYGILKADTSQRFMSGSTVTELPGTQVEVNSIEQILKKNTQVSKWMSVQATEENLKGIHSPKILHIATHGFFMSDLPSESTERSLTGMATGKLYENPLFRSGLLLAGAGKTITGQSQSSGEDGILTAYEAMNLDLQKTDLVVMSACETGLGTISSGEGVYGLPRAFRAAGAQSVLMSLWKVDDTATQQLMTGFYGQWQQGSKQVSFRQAQQQLRAKFPHPYYWGAFVMIGN